MAACNTRKPSICHAVVAVFLQFFSWGLITAPMIHILNTTFQVEYPYISFTQNINQNQHNLTGLKLSCSYIQSSFSVFLFQDQALLMNGVVMGVKGFLSFLSAPLIGALSDVFGRKMFLLITALFTCLPVPFLKVL